MSEICPDSIIQHLTDRDKYTLTLTQHTQAHTHTDSMLLKVSPCSHWIRLSVIEPESEYETECVCLSVAWRQLQTHFSSKSFTSFPHFLLLLPPFTASSFFFSSLQPLSNLPKYHNAFSSLFCFTCCVIDQCGPNARTPSRLQRVIAVLGCGPVKPICSISVSRAKCRSRSGSEAKLTYVSRPVIPRWAARRGVCVCVFMEKQGDWGWFDKQCRHGCMLSEVKGSKGHVCICSWGICRWKVKRCWWRVTICGVPSWQ